MIQFSHDSPEREPIERSHQLDAIIGQELQRRGTAPDLTDAIMLRLGFAPSIGCEASRGRCRMKLQAWLRRGWMAAAAATALAVGLTVHQSGSDARRPSGATIPGALHSDLQSVDRLMQRIRSLVPVVPESPSFPHGADPALPDDSNHGEFAPHPAAVAPFQWV